MNRAATTLLGVLLLLTCCTTAGFAANRYPPGPGGTCVDSLKVFDIQNTAATCHPVVDDTVNGVGGIITGFDDESTGFGFFMQNRASGANGAPWTGVDVFTGSTLRSVEFSPRLARGDSVVVYGRIAEFGGATEVVAYGGSFGNPSGLRIRRVSSGNPLPAFHVGTAAELQELPSNPNAEQWEGSLVRVNGPLRVVRTSLTGGLGTGFSFLAVDNIVCPDGSLGPCDSLFVDGATLSEPNYGSPPVGTVVSMVQGIYWDQTRGYRIQLRDFNDIVAAAPPNLVDAYSVADDTLRLVFDRPLDQATAEDEMNYSLASFRVIKNAALVETNVVHLAYNTTGPNLIATEALGESETATASGIVSAAGGAPMGNQSVSFIEGILSIAALQAPDPAFLAAMPCDDRSKYAGAGSNGGPTLTFRGVVTAEFGNVFYMSDPGGGARSSMGEFAPLAKLVPGRQYLVVGSVQEFFTETEGTFNVYLRDEGPAAIPAPTVQTIPVLKSSTCDVNQNTLTGEDFEGVLVRVQNTKITGSALPPEPGDSFLIAGPQPTYVDTMLVADRADHISHRPPEPQPMDVIGILGLFNTFRLNPRSDGDIVLIKTGVDPGIPAELSFSVYPNPGHRSQVSFGLPRDADVELGVYDLAGRKVRGLEKGTFPAGTHASRWDGRDSQGNAVRSGMYFYRLKVGNEIRQLRAVRLD